ncbi:hypothetical protein B1H10_08505 [candidate division KSB1 bacterium 4484_188]|nr:MAG: hypothetical protein B1H10_08505 [candidate division KSB1 bacterium 4484_188]
MIWDKNVTAIVSAYNEERTIEDVIIRLLSCYLVDELIVVNDGSTDKSGQIISKLQKSYSFKYIEFPQNLGKSYTMATGVETAQGEVIVFVDADIIGLKCSHIHKMLYPLLNREADMVIGQPYAGTKKIKEKITLLIKRLFNRGFPNLSDDCRQLPVNSLYCKKFYFKRVARDVGHCFLNGHCLFRSPGSVGSDHVKQGD